MVNEIALNGPVIMVLSAVEADGTLRIYKGLFQGLSASAVEEYFEECATELYSDKEENITSEICVICNGTADESALCDKHKYDEQMKGDKPLNPM